MKQLKYLFFSILLVCFILACSKKENHNNLLRKIMLQQLESNRNLKGLPFKDTILENGDFFFGLESEAERYSLQGNYQLKGDYLVFKLYEIYGDGIAESSLTGIYKMDSCGWTSVFKEPLVYGSLDSIIDLNNDEINEIIINVRTIGARGKDPCDRLILYGQKTSNYMEEIGILAERINSDGNLVKNYTLNYEPNSEGIIIMIKSEEGNDLDANDPQKTTIHRFKWLPPLFVDLNKPDYEQTKIGEQIWMTTNLDLTIFRNGEPIPEIKTDGEWIKAGENKQPAWCYFNNDSAIGAKYGKLYNWYAVNDPRGFAPEGWRIPNDDDWLQLTDFLGGENVAGTKMRSVSGWNFNGNGTNESGFNALPGGDCNIDGTFGYDGCLGYWWSVTESSNINAWVRSLSCESSVVSRGEGDKGLGFSVRCLRD